MEKKTLIVYYSNSGTAQKIALHIKELLPEADIDRIGYAGRNFKKYTMFAALFKMFGEPQAIEGDAHDPSEYERLILVFPIWAGMPASVMRSYIKKRAAALNEKEYNAVIVGGDVKDNAQQWIQGRGIKPPAEILRLKQKQVEADDYNLTSII